MEIAVNAFHLAERHLNVDSEIHYATHNFSTTSMTERVSSASIYNDLYLHRPLARSVIFAEENTLPTPQNEPSFLHKYLLARAGENCLGVRIRIPLGMPVRATLRNKPVHKAFEIRCNIRVGVFVDTHTCRRVRHIDLADTLFHPRFCDNRLHFSGDIYNLRAALCAHAKSLNLCHSQRIVARVFRLIYGIGTRKCVPRCLPEECFCNASRPSIPQRASSGSRQSSRDCRVLFG